MTDGEVETARAELSLNVLITRALSCGVRPYGHLEGIGTDGIGTVGSVGTLRG